MVSRGMAVARADEELAPPEPAGPRSVRLSSKERAVLSGLARGWTTEAIADSLYVSPHTVRTHVKNSMRKLVANTRTHAVAIAISEGAIDAPPVPPEPPPTDEDG